ncbi:hypothetical protein [Methylobacterium persicinum]|uniref:Uncharacterized protein n=1 Tax=Methylobacterium persicinum TaxID=374426 RepID=A0ABU0HPL1_9HYPH|nr:hypothetical protein [Methylobacterium persicinum]MDQ0444260.1 hypothetical protein [Methylobacterium persicinum]GJE39646.1 hypothetical protein KHHGKMAE_3730 [Methylobacterium persicinum]
MNSQNVDAGSNKTLGARADNSNMLRCIAIRAGIFAILAFNLTLSLLSGHISPSSINSVIVFCINFIASIVIVLYSTYRLAMNLFRGGAVRKINVLLLTIACVSIAISTQDSKIGVSSNLWLFLYNYDIAPICGLNGCKYVTELSKETQEICNDDICTVLIKFDIFDECEYQLSIMSDGIKKSDLEFRKRSFAKDNITIIRKNHKLIQTRACKS